MKFVAILMVLIGVAIGAGAVLEFRYFGPATPQFWAGCFAAPAGGFFTIAGILLWRRGLEARRTVLLAGLSLASATVIATALDVMGPFATLLGMFGAFVAIGSSLRSRALGA